jgi:hypothetical protein
MEVNEEGKKRGIKYSPNLDTIALNAKIVWERHTIEGRATEDERIAAEVISNPEKI